MQTAHRTVVRTGATRGRRIPAIRGTSAVLVVAVMLVGCGGSSGPDRQAGPAVAYVNTTGYRDGLRVAWEPAATRGQYLLTRSDRQGTQQIPLSVTEFLDTQAVSDDLYGYSVQSTPAGGTPSLPGTQVMARNNRAMVAALDAGLRAATSESEVRAVLGGYMDRYFDQVFVGLDADGLGYGDRALLFSFFVAHNFAAYANSKQYQLLALLQEPALDCDNYVALTARLFALLTDGARADAIEYYGFDGGPIGNHAQLLYTPESGTGVWLVDPTVGLLARYGSTDAWLTGGKPRRVSDYYAYYESDTQPADMLAYEQRIRNAVDSGGYARDQIIYRYTNLADFIEYHFIQRADRIE